MKQVLILAALALPVSLAAQAPSPQLKAVLDQMDAASAHFKSAEVDVKSDIYDRAAHADSYQTGTLFIERNPKGESMGAINYDLEDNGTRPKSPSKIVSYDGSTMQVYSPGNNQVDIFKAGANQAKYETFLTLGFGGSGKDLAKAWNIQDMGSETIDGVKTEKLDLVAKDDSVKKTFTHVTIWIDPTRDISLKQIFYSRDNTRTTTYSNIKLNATINRKPYVINSKATRIPHD
jgi:outer membrane lipoprotein-sorting protein